MVEIFEGPGKIAACHSYTKYMYKERNGMGPSHLSESLRTEVAEPAALELGWCKSAQPAAGPSGRALPLFAVPLGLQSTVEPWQLKETAGLCNQGTFVLHFRNSNSPGNIMAFWPPTVQNTSGLCFWMSVLYRHAAAAAAAAEV